MRILIIKPSSLGDVVQALPVLRVLKRYWPASEIYWWIERSSAPLLEGDADLSGIFVFERKGWRRTGWWRDVWSQVQTVRALRFDLVLDLQGLFRSGLFAWLAGGKTVIGLDNPREGNREGAQMFYDVLAPPSPSGTPATERYLGILSALDLPVNWNFDWLPLQADLALEVHHAQSNFASGGLPTPALLTKNGQRAAYGSELTQHRWVMLLPGARWDNKRWPVEYYARMVGRLSETPNSLRFAVLGAAADKPLAEVICRAAPQRCLDLTGKTTLAQMIEWLRAASLVIANDTGPMHVAAALGRPLVALYGPSDPSSTGPHRQKENVQQARHLPCVPCMKQSCAYIEPLACLRSITPEAVCDKALRLLEDACK